MQGLYEELRHYWVASMHERQKPKYSFVGHDNNTTINTYLVNRLRGVESRANRKSAQWLPNTFQYNVFVLPSAVLRRDLNRRRVESCVNHAPFGHNSQRGRQTDNRYAEQNDYTIAPSV